MGDFVFVAILLVLICLAVLGGLAAGSMTGDIIKYQVWKHR